MCNVHVHVCIVGGGGASVKAAATNQLTNDRVHPPDKKKFEKEKAEINRRIKELEAKLVSCFTKEVVLFGFDNY